MNEEEYNMLLDRIFSNIKSLSEQKSDFVIPKAVILQEGNKTIVKNIMEIADKARRDPAHIAKFISKELGVPANISNNMLYINSRVPEEDINKKIERYFNIFVICRECKKADTHLESAGRGKSYLVCEACGARYIVMW
ncbi:MAG: translation initiation factor 2 subunit beta [Candidatus Micrarchaeota archaeon]|nr:MAG: translation initiation factor 2 subunit beta [Candidatus Micrarchaeota archaeon]